MSEFKIEKNVPLIGRERNALATPHPEMEIGDSFLLADIDEVKFMRARRNIYAWAQRHHRKFTTRKTPEGYRCWRIA